MGPESEGGGPGSEPPPGSVMQAHGRAQRSVPRPPCPSHATGCCCCSHPARQGGVGTRASGWIRPPVRPGRGCGLPHPPVAPASLGPISRALGREGPHRSGASTACSGGARQVGGQHHLLRGCASGLASLASRLNVSDPRKGTSRIAARPSAASDVVRSGAPHSLSLRRDTCVARGERPAFRVST